ncbi:MAG TPA: carbon-nitrogen hydrolase family protein [Mycobacteriales bacterium]|nr:carbon-nitrogen hydrolase family protein [Mycobacteriales bacterium]
MEIAVAQYALGGDKPANLETLRRLVETAADRGAGLVVGPEGAMHDFLPVELSLAQVAEPLDGPFVTGLSEVAARREVTIVAGMFESVEGDAGHAYNTVVAIGPDGRLIGRYRKQHLFDALGWRESDRLAGGAASERLVFDCGDLRVGVLTCYDIRFPELSRALADDGVTVLVTPAAWVAGPLKAQQFRTLATARAIENVCYLAASVANPPTYTGESCIIDPFGVVLASLEGEPGVAVAEVSVERLAECRERMPSLEHRRWRVVPA